MLFQGVFNTNRKEITRGKNKLQPLVVVAVVVAVAVIVVVVVSGGVVVLVVEESDKLQIC